MFYFANFFTDRGHLLQCENWLFSMQLSYDAWPDICIGAVTLESFVVVENSATLFRRLQNFSEMICDLRWTERR